jgi:hypothetical protein
MAEPAAKIPTSTVPFLQQVRRHQKWNISVFLVEAVTSCFHWGFFETPVFAAYLLALGCPRMMIAAAPAAYMLAWFLPMVLYVPLIQRHAGRVRQMILWGLPTRLALPIIALSAMATVGWGPQVGVLGVWVGIAVLMVAGGPLHVCWQDLNSRIVVPAARGRYVGVRMIAVTVGFLSAGLVTYALLGDVSASAKGAASVHPAAFGLPFLVGAGVYAAALPLLFLFREPIPDGRPPPWQGYWSGLRRVFGVLRSDRPFCRFLGARAVTCAVWFVPMTLMSAYANHAFGIRERDIALYFTAAFFLAQAVSAPIGGALGDRGGHKLVHCLSLGIFGVAHVVALVLGLLPFAVPPQAAFPVFMVVLALMGAGASWYFMSQFNLVFEFAEPHRRSSYIALSGLAIGPAVLVASLLGGWLADTVGYVPTLYAALGLDALAVFLAMRYMPEPRRELAPRVRLGAEKP